MCSVQYVLVVGRLVRCLYSRRTAAAALRAGSSAMRLVVILTFQIFPLLSYRVGHIKRGHTVYFTVTLDSLNQFFFVICTLF